ncbi:hypothetical protein Dalu01_02383 [Deinococcus aluminii]|uniref:Transposase n=1 Tax=Deinococcus aluminii TaxID=1656885 RepID=A0ABP9XF23_9DEIO
MDAEGGGIFVTRQCNRVSSHAESSEAGEGNPRTQVTAGRWLSMQDNCHSVLSILPIPTQPLVQLIGWFDDNLPRHDG